MIHEDYPQLVIGARTIVRAALVENDPHPTRHRV